MVKTAYLGCPFSAWRYLREGMGASRWQDCRSRLISTVPSWISGRRVGSSPARSGDAVLMFTLRQARHRSNHTVVDG